MVNRILALGLALVLWAVPAWAQTLVQFCSSRDTASNSCAVDAFATITEGSAIFLATRGADSEDISGWSGCALGTWTRAYRIASGSLVNELWYLLNASAGACAPVPSFSVGSDVRVRGLEFSGVATTSALDQTASTTGSGDLDSGATSTTTQATELLIGSAATNNYQTTVTGTSGWALWTTWDGNRTVLLYRVVSATGTYNATATLSDAGTWTGGIATFKAAGGGDAGAAPRLTLLGVGPQ